MSQRISAVADDDAVDAILNLLANLLSQGYVFLGRHVLGEHGEHLLGVEVADVSQFRHSAIQLTR